MERISDGLFQWRDMLQRHNCAVLMWNMKGEDGRPCLEYVSETIREYGYEADAFLDGDIHWEELVFDEDKNRMDQEISNFLLHAAGNLHQEYRVVTKSGKVLWVEADSCYIRNEAENSAYVETVIRDISRSKEKEFNLLQNQLSLQKEIFTYMETKVTKSFKEILSDVIREQKIELLQAAFCELYGVHAAIIGKDYDFYTHMTGPKEEEGVFYDLSELRSFRKKINRLEDILNNGQRNIILSMQNPAIKISGVPILYKKEYVATWVVCCLEGKKPIEEILKILEFMRVMSESIIESYSQYEGEASVKGCAYERYRLQQKVLMQEKLLELYEEKEEKTAQEKLLLCLKKAGETSKSSRCTLYESLKNSIYARCVCSWMKQEASWDETEREMYSVQALPDPGELLKGQEMVVLNSVHVPKEWRDTMKDLYASAAVLTPVKWNGKEGFLCFQEIGATRVWEEEYLWLFTVIGKIIEKALLKSE